MKLSEVKSSLGRYIHLDHTEVLDIICATVLANRVNQNGSLIWLAVVGESSSGKSQLINPLAISDEDYFIRIDDLTENAFLSGSQGGSEKSILTPDKTNNMLVISDLTVLFSKSDDAKNAILSQFRVLFDGRIKKESAAIKGSLEWSGRMGVVAGTTPSIYHHFENVADMGERFLMYRLPPNNKLRSMELALKRPINGKALNTAIADLYGRYLEGIGRWILAERQHLLSEDLSDDLISHIMSVSLFAEQLRTPVAVDYHGQVAAVPVSAYPVRTALQLKAVAQMLEVMNHYEETRVCNTEAIVDHLAWSLCDETSRLVLEVFSSGEAYDAGQVADVLSLPASTTRRFIERLVARKVMSREKDQNDVYRLRDPQFLAMVRRMTSNEQIYGGAFD